MRASRFVLLWFCCSLFGCSSAPSTTGISRTPGLSAHGANETTPEEMEALYQEWDRVVESELERGKSWIWGDERLNKQLGEMVASRPGFFLEKLNENMFVVLILEQSPLYRANLQRLRTLRSIQARQAAWKEILEGIVETRTEMGG